MPGPPIERGGSSSPRSNRGEASEADVDRSIERILAARRVGRRRRQLTTAETTATDDETPRRDPARGGRGDGAAQERTRRPAARAGDDADRGLIGPNARVGQPQGGGSAEVRLDHGLGPYDALTARGFDVTLETGGRIAKYVPPFAGSWDVTFFDEHGHSMDATASRTKWFWDQPPSSKDQDWEFDGPAVRRPGPRLVRTRRLRRVGDRCPRRRRRDVAVGRRTAHRHPHRRARRGVLRSGQPRASGAGRRRGRPELRDRRRVPGGARPVVRGISFGARVVESGDPLERGGRSGGVGRRGRRCRRHQRRVRDRGRGSHDAGAARRAGRAGRRRSSPPTRTRSWSSTAARRHDAMARRGAGRAPAVVPRPGDG